MTKLIDIEVKLHWWTLGLKEGGLYRGLGVTGV